MRQIILKTFIYLSLLALALSMLIPFLWMVATSLMDEFEVYHYPPKFLPDRLLWSNYWKALTALPFGRFFLNTAIMAAGVVMGQLILCSTAAYAFARLRFRGRDKLFWVVLASMMIPGVITLIPGFLIIQTLGWMNTYWALIVPTVSSAWGIFLLRQFFLTLPRELEDAARIDGASEFTIYFRIVLPLSKPALATLGIFAFMGTWQSFLWPLIVTDRMDMRPVEVGIAMFHSLYAQNWPYQMAAAVTVMVPIIVVFFIAQKYFIRGIVLTGLKE